MAKILLVEDDTNLSEIYQARMEAEGYLVVAASDGESALALAAQEKPDLIISDVMMPKISGFEMLDILRNTEGLKDTPVIMLTALGQADDKTRADALGANRYLVKSQVTLEDIVNAAHSLLETDATPAGVSQDSSAPSLAQVLTQTLTNAPPAIAPTAATSSPADPADENVPVIPLAVAPATPPSTPPAADPIAPTVSLAPPAVDEAPATGDPTTNYSPEIDQTRQSLSVAGQASEEAATVKAKIDGFEHRPITPVRVPPINDTPIGRTERDTTAVTAASLDERVVANAIDKILSKSPQAATSPPEPPTTAPAAPGSEPQFTPEAASAETLNHGQVLPTTTPETVKAQQDDRPLKKVISPISRPPETTLEELLAREAATEQGGQEASATASGLTQFQAVQTEPVQPQPADIIQPPVQPPTNPRPDNQPQKPPFDPNSIAL